jgi:hypothetical protein
MFLLFATGIFFSARIEEVLQIFGSSRSVECKSSNRHAAKRLQPGSTATFPARPGLIGVGELSCATEYVLQIDGE